MAGFFKHLLTAVFSIICTLIIVYVVVSTHTFEVKKEIIEVPESRASEVYQESQNGVLTVLNQKLVSPDSIYEYILSDGEEYNYTQGLGSGFIYAERDGYYYAMTNYHVVAGSDQIQVYPTPSDADEEITPETAEVIGSDETYDVAVLKFKSDQDLHVFEIADSSEIQAGDPVYAIGSPFGQEFAGSITEGIISSPNRALAFEVDGEAFDFIQTDAAINPGNSGGPLIDTNGAVVGMNSQKIAGEEYEGIGLAIPSNTFLEIASEIEEGE